MSDNKQSFEDWKQSYIDKSKHGIKVDCDGGHAYHVSPYSYDECEDEEAACDFDSDYLSNQGPQLYCEVPTPEFPHMGCCSECFQSADDQAEYIDGFIQQRQENGYPLKPDYISSLMKLKSEIMITKIVKS